MTRPVVELVSARLVEQRDGNLRLTVRGIVNGREYETILMTSEKRVGAPYSRISLIEAHRQLRRQIARSAR